MSSDPYQIAMRLLSYRWRSEDELRKRLERDEIPSVQVDETLRRLTDEGWIDDERFAREFVRSRARRHGRRRIGNDLRRLGIDQDAASLALEQELTHDDEDSVLKEAASKKIASLSWRHGNDYTSSEVGRRKLARFLLARGYPAAAVRKAVFEMTNPSPAENAEGSGERE